MPLTIVDVEKDPYYKKGIEQGMERERIEGKYRKAIETAKRLHQMGLSLEKISEAVNLSLEKVKQILHK